MTQGLNCSSFFNFAATVSASRRVGNLPTRTRKTEGVPSDGTSTYAMYPFELSRFAIASASPRTFSAAIWTTNPLPAGSSGAVGASDAAAGAGASLCGSFGGAAGYAGGGVARSGGAAAFAGGAFSGTGFSGIGLAADGASSTGLVCATRFSTALFKFSRGGVLVSSRLK